MKFCLAELFRKRASGNQGRYMSSSHYNLLLKSTGFVVNFETGFIVVVVVA